MKTSRTAAVLATAAALFALAGCATPISGGGATGATSTPSSSASETDESAAPVEAQWAPGGSGILLTTWGSSTCVPVSAGLDGDGQDLTALFVEPDADAVCTMDYTERVTYIAVPDTTDRATDVSLAVTLDDVDQTLDVAPYTGEITDTLPQAGLVGDGLIAIVSEGSSSCIPAVSETSDETATTLTVTFAEHEGACTRDLVPRATLVASDVVTAGATLTLVNLEGAADPITVTLAG